jgi:hypothetical protein
VVGRVRVRRSVGRSVVAERRVNLTEHVLVLLRADRRDAVTVADLRERGIEAPAQLVYELQLAGCEVDRVRCDAPGGWGYRLSGESPGEARRRVEGS